MEKEKRREEKREKERKKKKDRKAEEMSNVDYCYFHAFSH